MQLEMALHTLHTEQTALDELLFWGKINGKFASFISSFSTNAIPV
jgi:hypothetical protein